MSAGKWDEIEFDKIPSRAGMIYKNAFARHDIERMKNDNVQSYADFAKDTEAIENGVFYESKHRSAPYFDVRIDGITLLDESY